MITPPQEAARSHEIMAVRRRALHLTVKPATPATGILVTIAQCTQSPRRGIPGDNVGIRHHLGSLVPSLVAEGVRHAGRQDRARKELWAGERAWEVHRGTLGVDRQKGKEEQAQGPWNTADSAPGGAPDA